MGPWTRVSSEVRHLGLWRVGEPLSTRGRVAALWECIYQVATKELSV